jgi:hypothetical protein
LVGINDLSNALERNIVAAKNGFSASSFRRRREDDRFG